jgi:hypothetical protein
MPGMLAFETSERKEAAYRRSMLTCQNAMSMQSALFEWSDTYQLAYLLRIRRHWGK